MEDEFPPADAPVEEKPTDIRSVILQKVKKLSSLSPVFIHTDIHPIPLEILDELIAKGYTVHYDLSYDSGCDKKPVANATLRVSNPRYQPASTPTIDIELGKELLSGLLSGFASKTKLF